jgi:hypothetical protein
MSGTGRRDSQRPYHRWSFFPASRSQTLTQDRLENGYSRTIDDAPGVRVSNTVSTKAGRTCLFMCPPIFKRERCKQQQKRENPCRRAIASWCGPTKRDRHTGSHSFSDFSEFPSDSTRESLMPPLFRFERLPFFRSHLHELTSAPTTTSASWSYHDISGFRRYVV